VYIIIIFKLFYYTGSITKISRNDQRSDIPSQLSFYSINNLLKGSRLIVALREGFPRIPANDLTISWGFNLKLLFAWNFSGTSLRLKEFGTQIESLHLLIFAINPSISFLFKSIGDFSSPCKPLFPAKFITEINPSISIIFFTRFLFKKIKIIPKRQ